LYYHVKQPRSTIGISSNYYVNYHIAIYLSINTYFIVNLYYIINKLLDWINLNKTILLIQQYVKNKYTEMHGISSPFNRYLASSYEYRLHQSKFGHSIVNHYDFDDTATVTKWAIQNTVRTVTEFKSFAIVCGNCAYISIKPFTDCLIGNGLPRQKVSFQSDCLFHCENFSLYKQFPSKSQLSIILTHQTWISVKYVACKTNNLLLR